MIRILIESILALVAVGFLFFAAVSRGNFWGLTARFLIGAAATLALALWVRYAF